jgi:hypothetical protein
MLRDARMQRIATFIADACFLKLRQRNIWLTCRQCGAGEGLMDDLIGRLVAIAGVDRTAAAKAVAVARPSPPASGQSRGAPLPAGVNASLRKRNTGRIDAITRETLSFARDTAGEAAVGATVDAIPGLGRFV